MSVTRRDMIRLLDDLIFHANSLNPLQNKFVWSTPALRILIAIRHLIENIEKA